MTGSGSAAVVNAGVWARAAIAAKIATGIELRIGTIPSVILQPPMNAD
jgi:hypothetical protein